MIVILTKVSDDRHSLELVHDGGSRERVVCETRSYLVHDLLHYAVEAEARIASGFWGRLAAGATLAEMNDRTRPMDDAMAAVEQVVGALSGVTKGRSAGELVSGIRRFSASVGAASPEWLTEPFVAAVEERMRRLLGRWNATPRGGRMELRFPEPQE